MTLEEQEYSPGEYEFEIALSPAREVVLKVHPPAGEKALDLLVQRALADAMVAKRGTVIGVLPLI